MRKGLGAKPATSAVLTDYRQAIRATNVTGLASRRQYELVFKASARETRNYLCAWVPFMRAMQDAGLPQDGVVSVGLFPPGLPLSKSLQRSLREIEEVVNASGTQVLEMREGGGVRSRQFTVEGRQECAIALIALGDVCGTAVRVRSWVRTGRTWEVSAFALRQASLYGWSLEEYERLHRDFPELVPAPWSPALQGVPTGSNGTDSEADGRPWITFEAMATLIGS